MTSRSVGDTPAVSKGYEVTKHAYNLRIDGEGNILDVDGHASVVMKLRAFAIQNGSVSAQLDASEARSVVSRY